MSCYDLVVMKSALSFGGKRELLARGLLWSGASFLLSQLPARDSLLVLNYHRIGNPNDDLFDPGVFSATADQFDNQISYLKRHVSLVTLEEALAFIDGTIKEKMSSCRVLITFDDGYLDNYNIAFPILRSHGAQGVFFLATSMVGSCHLPWWDHIAFLVKTARTHRFTLSYPSDLAVDLDKNGLNESLRAVLRSYKNPANSDSARFIQELGEASMGEDPPKTMRRFLSWDEAREMSKCGMAIGSHTHSHHVLSQLEPSRQYEELSTSRAILKEQLGVEVDVLAYPVGGRTSFTDQTRSAAREAGYRAAFSFYGGTNLPGKTSPYDVNRIGIDNQSQGRLRVRTAVCSATGKFWP
jgi:peptidoglycan/xylan/chitin deacetylase (PgdA/CDA1 family)